MEETNEEKAQRLYLATIMQHLMSSKRFRLFYQANYEVKVETHEEGYPVVVVVENPPQLAEEKLKALIIKEKSQDDTPNIVTANLNDLKALEEK